MAFTLANNSLQTLLDTLRLTSTDYATFVGIRKTGDVDSAKAYEVAIYRNRTDRSPAYLVQAATISAALTGAADAQADVLDAQVTALGDEATAIDTRADAIRAAIA